MIKKYFLTEHLDSDILYFVDFENVKWFVPIEEKNPYYQEYLAWLAEGNEPEVIE
jgi:hypothetical protein